MEIYLVGGCVRDKLSGFPVKDNDYVVVGATTEQMLRLGFKQVGKDFPVFLHPETKEEYALARKVKRAVKSPDVYCYDFSPDITLEDDLAGRDLTINAIAMKENGEIIDPFGGQTDLEHRILRHVSASFADDPIRVLRTARFLAMYQQTAFTIAAETMKLMKKMVKSGELNNLTPERVWLETNKALQQAPWIYFETLRECGALEVLFPELDRLFGIPQPPQYHPEIDTGVHTIMVLKKACELSEDPVIRWAALLHDLGKGVTPEESWPKHHEHESLGVPLVEAVCARWKVPNDYKELALLACEYHLHCHKALEMKPGKIIKLFDNLDVFRKQYLLEPFLMVCEADARGRKDFEDRDYPQTGYLRKAFRAALEVDTKPLVEKGYKGKEFGFQLNQLRIKAVSRVRSMFM